MRNKLVFIAGAAVGYVLGSRQGREAYEKIKTQAQNLWGSPQVRDTASKASGLVRDKVPHGDKVADVAESVAAKADEKVSEASSKSDGDSATQGDAKSGDDSKSDDGQNGGSPKPSPSNVAGASDA